MSGPRLASRQHSGLRCALMRALCTLRISGYACSYVRPGCGAYNHTFLWCFNIVGGEILTFPDTLTTQGLSLWCFNIVGDSRHVELSTAARTEPPVGDMTRDCPATEIICARVAHGVAGRGTFRTLTSTPAT